MPELIRDSVRVNVEADSLNAAVLGPDVEPGSETYELFLKDVVRDMTQKAGQKCTAIRRVLVPAAVADRVRDDLVDRLSAVIVGNPATEGVRMGPVATAAQLADVRAGIEALARDGRLVFGRTAAPRRRSRGQGLLRRPGADRGRAGGRGADRPLARGLRPGGDGRPLRRVTRRAPSRSSPAATAASSRRSTPRTWRFTAEVALGLAPYHGRLFLGSAKIAEQSPGPGTVLPTLVHGGPGRAGGGEELGGLRGLAFYMQRVALEGSRPVIERIAGIKA